MSAHGHTTAAVRQERGRTAERVPAALLPAPPRTAAGGPKRHGRPGRPAADFHRPVRGAGACRRLKSREFYEAFSHWCANNGHTGTYSIKAVSVAVQRLGLLRVRQVRPCIVYGDVRLRPGV